MSVKAASGLAIAEISSFHIGGSSVELTGQPKRQMRVAGEGITREVDLNGSYVTGQLYAQSIRLAHPATPAPVMFWHGGAMTGATWETTPDGRPGWQWLFLQAGYNVIVTDAVERGRASWSPFPQIYREAPIFRTMEETWVMYRFGAAEDYQSRTAFPGQRFPVTAFDALCAQLVPRWTGHDELTLAAYDQLLRKVGPVILIAHSQGGWLAANLVWRMPEFFKAVILIEPAGAPVLDSEKLLSAAGVPHLAMWCDYISHVPAWVRYRSAANRHMEDLMRAGGQADLIDLHHEGILGNSHVPMMDTNNADIATLVFDWLREVI